MAALTETQMKDLVTELMVDASRDLRTQNLINKLKAAGVEVENLYDESMRVDAYARKANVTVTWTDSD